MYKSKSITLFVLALQIVLQQCHCTEEPPFPKLLSSTGETRLRIVSESVDAELGYKTSEEYVDFKAGKQAYLSIKDGRHQAVFVDGTSGRMYHYEPYKCVSKKVGEQFEVLDEQALPISVDVWDENSKTSHEMQLFGISALWRYAEVAPKTFSIADLIYSTGKNLFAKAYNWTFVIDKLEVSMFFISTKTSKESEPKLSLEAVQVSDKSTKRVKRNYNVYSVDYHIDYEARQSIFKVPVGFGCLEDSEAQEMDAETKAAYESYKFPKLTSSHKLELEVTGTKFLETEDGSGDFERTSYLQTVEFARITGFDPNDETLLIRKRDKSSDVKTILDFRTNVKYAIDIRSGGCSISSLGKYQPGTEEATLKFENNLTLVLDAKMMFELFESQDNCHFVKTDIIPDAGMNDVEHLYFERASNWGNQFVRIMRTYSVGSLDSVRLNSVTVWVLDETKTKIRESYRFDIVEARELYKWPEAPRTFDVSEECYLNNEKMKQGRDYAWIKVNFLMSNYHLEMLAKRATSVVERMHYSFFDSLVGFLRAPRAELIFEDTGLSLRVLLLDYPAYYKMFDAEEGKAIDVKSGGKVMEELSPDVEHCSDLCRLYQCQSLTFCDEGHRCLLSTKPTGTGTDQAKVKNSSACTTYSINTSRGMSLTTMQRYSLNRLLSDFQHQDYRSIKIPAAPDELNYPLSESGLSTREYASLIRNYVRQIRDFIATQPLIPFTLIYEFKDSFVMLKADKFEVEQDPLDEFDIVREDDVGNAVYDGDLNAAFHTGLGTHRYNINLLSDGMHKDFHLFTGLSYDQCALACLDGKCSSFSFCKSRSECILTNINSTEYAEKKNLIQVDTDCVIAQRDFITNFHQIGSVHRPKQFSNQMQAHGPSECALFCMQQSDSSTCTAFDYCAPKTPNLPGDCYFTDRELEMNNDNDDAKANATTGSLPGKDTCSHYSRSYLADFLRIEYREIKYEELDKLRHTYVDGQSIHGCARMCAHEIENCSAFQFCLYPDSRSSMQSCVMIESTPKEPQQREIVLDESGNGTSIVTSDLFVANTNCHVFSLRSNTNEARARDLALRVITKSNGDAASGAKFSIFGDLLSNLFLLTVVAAISGGVSYGCYKAKDYEFHLIERLRLLLNI